KSRRRLSEPRLSALYAHRAAGNFVRRKERGIRRGDRRTVRRKTPVGETSAVPFRRAEAARFHRGGRRVRTGGAFAGRTDGGAGLRRPLPDGGDPEQPAPAVGQYAG